MNKYFLRSICISLIVLAAGCSGIKPVNQNKLESNEDITAKPEAGEKDSTSVQNPEPEPTVTQVQISSPKSEVKNTEKVKAYCDKVDTYFEKYKWGKSNCEKFQWHHVRNSYWGNPIVWYVFGDEKQVETDPKKTTMILCGVHGDEITPVKFCYDILNDLRKNSDIIKDNLLVIAPIVSPDSFFRKAPTRTNGRGVDANRNFPTKDWNAKALKIWKQRYGSDKRRYPGKKSMSEQETYFQVNLIKRYNPAKIISVHAPLTLIDYDGPAAEKHEGARQLLIQMSDKAGKYRINDYPFFPGSLGNWAGNERNIPTYTLELPNSDWTKTAKFYDTFKMAIFHAVNHTLETDFEENKKLTDTEETQTKNDKVL